MSPTKKSYQLRVKTGPRTVRIYLSQSTRRRFNVTWIDNGIRRSRKFTDEGEALAVAEGISSMPNPK